MNDHRRGRGLNLRPLFVLAIVSVLALAISAIGLLIAIRVNILAGGIVLIGGVTAAGAISRALRLRRK